MQDSEIKRLREKQVKAQYLEGKADELACEIETTFTAQGGAMLGFLTRIARWLARISAVQAKAARDAARATYDR